MKHISIVAAEAICLFAGFVQGVAFGQAVQYLGGEWIRNMTRRWLSKK